MTGTVLYDESGSLLQLNLILIRYLTLMLLRCLFMFVHVHNIRLTLRQQTHPGRVWRLTSLIFMVPLHDNFIHSGNRTLISLTLCLTSGCESGGSARLSPRRNRICNHDNGYSQTQQEFLSEHFYHASIHVAANLL